MIDENTEKVVKPVGNPTFQPKWKTGKTIAVRIPESISDLVVSIARKIDNGELDRADLHRFCLDIPELEAQLTAIGIHPQPTQSVRDTGIYESIQELKLRADEATQKHGEALELIEFLGKQLKVSEKAQKVEVALSDGLSLIDQFESAQCAAWKTRAQNKGEFSTDSPRWSKYNEFKLWVSSLV